MPANSFVLTSDQIVVEYTTVGLSGADPQLSFNDGSVVKTFRGKDIATESTSLGTLVSFATRISIDTGGERFGFFLPVLDTDPGQPKTFATVGIRESFSGPDSFPRTPAAWQAVPLAGTAQTIETLAPVTGQ